MQLFKVCLIFLNVLNLNNCKLIRRLCKFNVFTEISILIIDYAVLICLFFYLFVRPINGQMEIVGLTNSYKATEWKAAEGIFVHPSSEPARKTEHTEL